MPFPLGAFPDISLITHQNIPVILSTNKGRMSTKNLWLISHKKDLNNGEVTKYIIRLLREQGITTKQAASKINLPVERARNWYYKDVGMMALDLIRMIEKYEFVRQAVVSSLALEK